MRRRRIELREELRQLTEEERFAEQGIKLMLTEPDLSSYILKVWEKEAHQVVEGFMNTQVAIRGRSANATSYLRLHWPDRTGEWISTYLDADSALAIHEREDAFKSRHGKSICQVVGELPPNVRASVAVPRIVRALLKNMAEFRLTWEQMRERNILHLGGWAYSIG